MNENEITVTVNTNDYNALTRASDMLNALATDLSQSPDSDNDETILEKVAEIQNVSVNSLVDVQADILGVDEPFEADLPPLVHSGVDLDSDGYPWDVRIHGVSRLKTKKDNKWKKIKNINKNKPGLVEQVEAELCIAMAASPNKPIVTNPIDGVQYQVENTDHIPTKDIITSGVVGTQLPAPLPIEVAEPDKYLVNDVEYTAEQLRESKWTDDQMKPFKVNNKHVDTVAASMTFPEFMAKVTPAKTAGTITDEHVTAALNTQGITSLPLLAARPNLIPAVAKALFG